MRYQIIYVFLILIPFELFTQELAPQQQALLYQISKKSNSIGRHWGAYFNYTGGIPEFREVVEIVDGIERTYWVDNWDSVEMNIIQYPEVLEIDWEAIRKSSPGLIADASLKLALWELYTGIRDGYEEVPPFSVREDIKAIYQEVVEALPDRMKNGNAVKEKFLHVFYDIINPSLSVKRKFASFEEVGKVTAQEKKKVFDRWHQLVTYRLSERSEKYFDSLIGKEVYFNGTLLAVGDGSGSRGLFGEMEDSEEGHEVNTGNGVGIGLFTYKMKVRKEDLKPDYISEVEYKNLKDEAKLIHLNMWGLDWTKYPTVVVEKGEKSYVLIGTPYFSPDTSGIKGITYFDRMKDFRKRKIDNVMAELKKEGGLLAVYERENRIKQTILHQIDSINLEIDSLRKLDNVSETAINNRKFKNDVNLTNLRDKERRMAEVQRKISAEYKKINNAEKELNKMKQALGQEPQSWEKQDDFYVFEDGSLFDLRTQDLILVQDSIGMEDIKVTLLAGTYSVYRDSKDEVQLYVNITGGVEDYLKELERSKEPVFISDTIINAVLYFKPDDYIASSYFSSNQQSKLKSLVEGDSLKKNFVFDLKAMGIDTLSHQDIIADQANYEKNKSKEKFKNARRVEIQVVETKDSCLVQIYGYADAGRTRLSNVKEKESWQYLKTKEQSLNTALSSLRVIAVINDLEAILGVSFREELIHIEPLGKDIKIRKLKQ